MSLPNPIVLLDARAKYVHPAFQMTRASTKTVWDSAGRLVTVPANALGWDHDPATGQARGYLAEPSATNLLLHSNDLTQPAWTKTRTSISGTTGDYMALGKLVEDTSNDTHHVNQNVSISSGATVAVQCIAKAGERSRLLLQAANASSIANFARADFDLFGGTVADEQSSGDGELVRAGMRHLGAGYYSCWIVGTLGSATQCNARVWLNDGSGLSYQGDGTSGLYLGKLQVEPGTYPTSYIETGGATATRAADSLVLPDLGVIPGWIGERGTLVLDIAPPKALASSHRRVADFGADLFVTINAAGICSVGGNGFASINLFGVVTEPAQRRQIAVTWDAEQVAAALDGAISGTQNVNSGRSISALGLGCTATGTNPYQGHIRRAVYYPQRLSNADIQSLTAIQE